MFINKTSGFYHNHKEVGESFARFRIGLGSSGVCHPQMAFFLQFKF